MKTGSLVEALDLGRSRAIAAVGGGGKSSLLAALGREFHDLFAERVILTTTTHILRPEKNGYFGEDPAALSDLLRRLGVLTVGSVIGGGRVGKPALFGVLPELADRVLIEADGTRGLPMKVPNRTEPVLPDCADTVIAVNGLSAIGRPIGEVCHRAELAEERFGYRPDTPVTAEIMAAVLTSPDGQRKGIGRRRFLVLLNQADAAPASAAESLAALLIGRGVERVAVAALQAAPGSFECFLRAAERR